MIFILHRLRPGTCTELLPRQTVSVYISAMPPTELVYVDPLFQSIARSNDIIYKVTITLTSTIFGQDQWQKNIIAKIIYAD
jgi:hypothetical protein